MQYCSRCMYPVNSRPTIIFDDEGVCSGCRYHEARGRIDWEERGRWFKELVNEYKGKSKKSNHYDCIIPVSGGKDSHFQTYLMKEVFGMNPLLVSYNHAFNTKAGVRNLSNLVNRFGCDLVRFTANPESVRRISSHMLKKVGDITWHYHAGITTFPIQTAVRYKIPLIVWGEEGFAELTGMFTHDYMVEFTKWKRKEHDMRGYEPEDLVADPTSGITWRDVAPYVYPTDEEIEEVGVRGIYLSNFINWDAKGQAELMVDKYGFEILQRRRDRTFNLFSKIDDHANDVHDYLKYLKFGYGRATDDASTEIRTGRMTREEGIELVKEYDSACPSTLDTYLDFLSVTEQEFYDSVESMRDLDIWEKDSSGTWVVKDSIADHLEDPGVEQARVRPSEDRTFVERNRHLYFSDQWWPNGTDTSLGGDSQRPENDFVVL